MGGLELTLGDGMPSISIGVEAEPGSGPEYGTQLRGGTSST